MKTESLHPFPLNVVMVLSFATGVRHLWSPFAFLADLAGVFANESFGFFPQKLNEQDIF
jgi:hypothetical protein